MANLIIKSTANDLVIQGSDASPAITVGTDGTTTFAEPATMSGTLGVTGNTTLSGTANNLGTVTAGTFPEASATALYPTGSVLQCKGVSSNTNWGTNSTSSETYLSQLDCAITTRGLNSNFYLTARFPTDNSASASFGVGLGFRYYIGSTETEIVDCHEHEDYNSAAENMYMVARNELFVTTINEAIGTAITFRVYVQFNNSNGAFSGSTNQLGQTHTVMEVQS